MSEFDYPRNFKGIWIPKEIWEHNELDFFEKMLWAEIDSLDDPQKGCFASNAYFQKFFNIKERFLQLGLAKLKNLGLIRYESFDGRSRCLRSCLKTTYEKFDTSEVKNCAPLGCTAVHPYIKEYKKEEVVCYPTPVGADSQKSLSKEEVKKMSVDAALKGLKLPSVLKKTHMDGHEIIATLEDMFLKSLQSKKDWKTSEIHEAWQVLADYSGPIREPFAFIEGTIKNFRTKEKCEYMKTQGKKAWNSKGTKITQQPTEDKPQLSEKDIVEHPSLGSILEKAGIRF